MNEDFINYKTLTICLINRLVNFKLNKMRVPPISVNSAHGDEVRIFNPFTVSSYEIEMG